MLHDPTSMRETAWHFFRKRLRAYYHNKGWRQARLAQAIGVSEPSLSQYLHGQVSIPDPIWARIITILELSQEDALDLRRAYELAQAGHLVQAYVYELEQERTVEAVCEERLEKLEALTRRLRSAQSARPNWRPFLVDPDEAQTLSDEDTKVPRLHHDPQPQKQPETDTHHAGKK
jgi:transcriptional regulator with XRE-family HTH domain